MVVAVMGGPPDRTFLRRGRADEGKNELEPTTRLVASVREVPMVDTGNTEHADCVEGHAHREGYPAKARPDYQEASEVNRPERCLLDQVNGLERVAAGIIHVLEFFQGRGNSRKPR